MPRDLNDLHRHAKDHYGLKDASHHHRGARELSSAEHVNQIREGDVIVIQGKSDHFVFDGTTSYREAFPVHPVTPRSVATRVEQRTPLPFEGTSSYRRDYPVHTIEPRALPEPPAKPESLPFYGKSTYGSSFPWHPHTPRDAPAPPTPREIHPFEGTSTYRTAYPVHALELRPRSAPVRAPPRPQAFEGRSTYNASFPGHEIPRQKIIYIEPAEETPRRRRRPAGSR